MIRLPNFIVLAYLKVPKLAKLGQTDQPKDRQNLRSLYVTWLIPSAIKIDPEENFPKSFKKAIRSGKGCDSKTIC